MSGMLVLRSGEELIAAMEELLERLMPACKQSREHKQVDHRRDNPPIAKAVRRHNMEGAARLSLAILPHEIFFPG